MAELPTGTVTFLFTDLEGSTRLWEEHPEAMRPALARHDEILRRSIEQHGGVVVKTTGDGVHCAFASATSAVSAAVDAQRQIGSEPWEIGTLRVRMGLHTGEAEERDGDYFGTTLNRAARLMASAHGGQIVLSRTTCELVRAAQVAGVDLVDLGEHRLRDLDGAERVFQVVAADLETSFPPLRSLDAFPGNLPQQSSSFVGREDDLAGVGDALAASRIVTLVGVGGVGKTRLATRVAAHTVSRFSDGAWLCELAAASDEDSMVQLVAATLRIQPRAGATLEQAVVDHLVSKDLLLVLDNCEHVLAPAARLTTAVLRGGGKVRVLATSREALMVDGEVVWPLQPLDVPIDAEDLERGSATRLFLDRARSVKPDFDPQGAEARAVLELCRRLDGLPLAIELAAARTSALSPTEIETMLDERFRLLTSGRRAADDRHQTLRSTVDWSYSLLEPRDRLVFDHLGVFAGAFDLDAVAAVASHELDRIDVVDGVSALVDKSLLLADSGEVTRYRMLETMRQYARDRLEEAGEMHRARLRHAEHHALLAERLYGVIRDETREGAGEPDEFEIWAGIVEHLDDFRAAVLWAIDQDDPQVEHLALRIISAFGNEVARHPDCGVGEWALRAVDAAHRAPTTLRATVLSVAAYELALRGGAYEGAVRLSEAALVDGLPDDCLAPAAVVAAASSSAALAGDTDRAIAVVHEYMPDLERIGSRAEQAALWTLLAMWYDARGDGDHARAAAEQALALAEASSNPSAMGLAGYAVGVAFLEADPERALAAVDESARLTRAGAGTSVFANALEIEARLLSRKGAHEDAARIALESLEYSVEIGSPIGVHGAFSAAIELLEAVGHDVEVATLDGVLGGEGAWVEQRRVTWQDEVREAKVDAVRQRLGEDRLAAARAEGAALSGDEAVVYLRGALEALLPS